ncbi:MAG TPA: FecR family protein [Segetibacter sp.]
MGNSNYFDELIVSYLSNELDTEEEAFVLDWINSSEENKQYFEKLKSTWNLLVIKETAKDINVDLEWDQFKQVISTNESELSPARSEHVDEEVEEGAAQGKKPKVYKFFISTAVAASIILIAALGWRFVNHTPAVEAPLAVNADRKIEEQHYFERTRFNNTNQPVVLFLRDGSQVTLYSKSKISYHEPFIGNKRDIRLVGKARFKVAKDKTKPFTVFTGDISTTALGTQFTITEMPWEKKIVVRLHEGKVVVKSTSASTGTRMKDVYLLAGQELHYNTVSKTGVVRNFVAKGKVAKKEIKKEELVTDNPIVPTYGKGSWFMFNNQPLNEIFDQLADMYNVRITYSKKEISKMFFIGTFDKSDSIDFVLKQIASINNLMVIKDNNNYTIKTVVSKQKK